MRLVSRLVNVDPTLESLEEWLLAVILAAVGFGLASWILFPFPSPALTRDLANIGIVLVLAYVVEAAWLTPHVVDDDDEDGDLGILLGIGITGMLGVIVAVLLSAHLAAGHGNRLDDFGFGWAVVSVLALAAMVILQPQLVHVWEGHRHKRGD